MLFRSSTCCLILLPLWRILYGKVFLRIIGAEKLLLVGSSASLAKIAQVLKERPELAHQFYTETSSMVRIDGDTSESGSTMLVSFYSSSCPPFVCFFWCGDVLQSHSSSALVSFLLL